MFSVNYSVAAILCGQTPDMDNSTKEIQGYNVGNTTSYECRINYKITGEAIKNTTSTCQLNPDMVTANWTEPTPCEGMPI